MTEVDEEQYAALELDKWKQISFCAYANKILWQWIARYAHIVRLQRDRELYICKNVHFVQLHVDDILIFND